MKKWKFKKILLIIVITILIIAALNFFKNEVKNFFYLISSPIQKTLWRAGARVSDFFEIITEIKNLKKEAEELKLKNQEFLAQITQLIEVKKENKILREALGIGLEKEFKLVLAEVVGKDISQDSILINKGSRDGITENLPVITQQKILLGKIGEVYQNFSRVILITNKKSAFDAKIPEQEISGVVKGKGNLQLLIDLVPQEKEIKKGNLIITTPLGGIFPAGLLVGQIKEVKKSDIEFFQQAEIKPAFDIKELETLFVITNF